MPSTLKWCVQRLLKQIGLYHRLRSSRLYDAYWMMADRRVIDETRAEVAFYRTHLQGFRHGDLVFDIGANEGYKTEVFLRIGARVVAVEPDEHNQAVLRNSFLEYRIAKRPVVIVGKAVSDEDSVRTLWIDTPGSAKNTLSRKWVEILRVDEQRFGVRLDFAGQRDVETVSLENLIATHGVPFFIKIDVEGHEPTVLRGLRRPVPYLSFEVNLPEFRPEGQQCIELLAELAPNGSFNYAADCRHGLRLTDWVGEKEFLSIFNACTERSIEVFWKSFGAAL